MSESPVAAPPPPAPPPPPAVPPPENKWAWPFPIHTVLVAIPMVLTYTHENIRMAEVSFAIWPILGLWLFSLPVFLLLLAISRDPRRAGAITSVFMLGFVSHEAMDDWAMYAWIAIGLACLGLALWRGSLSVPTTFGNIFAVLAVLVTGYPLIGDSQGHPAPHVRDDLIESLPVRVSKTTELPDIYYFVLDGYGRQDVLQDEFGVDDSFVKFLESRGFYVAHQAHSNYAQTGLSFASALNMAPLTDVLSGLKPTLSNRVALGEAIGDNRVVHALRSSGYRIVQYPGEYTVTHLDNADESRHPFVYFTEFDYIFFNDTAVLPFTQLLGQPQSRVAHEVRRNHISWVFDDLEARGGDHGEQPTFTYVHIVAPHPPFVFKPDGSYRPTRPDTTFADGSAWVSRAKKYGETYEDGYRDQVTWLNSRMEAVIDSILATSDREPMFVIQGDHGPGSHLDWKSQTKTDLRERMSILNAIRVPDQSRLYPTITPINNFRIVFDQALGADLPLLPDTSWFELWGSPYRFVDVTERLHYPDRIKPSAPAPKKKPKAPKAPKGPLTPDSDAPAGPEGQE